MPPKSKQQEGLGLEASLWEAANRLRSNTDPAEHEHVVLGPVFLKYVKPSATQLVLEQAEVIAGEEAA